MTEDMQEEAVAAALAPRHPPAAARGINGRGADIVEALTRHILEHHEAALRTPHPRASGKLGLTTLRVRGTSARRREALAPPDAPLTAPLPMPSIIAPLITWARAEVDVGAAEQALLLRQTGVARDVAYANGIEACARTLGDQCRDGACTEFDLTLALIRLQTLVRCMGAGSPAGMRMMPRRVLVAAAPLEQHGLGMAIASECFRAAGWDVDESLCTKDATMAGTVARRGFDALVLSLSGAHVRGDRIEALARTILHARRVASNPRLLVIVTGRAFTDGASTAHDVGADAACASATDAPRCAARRLAGRRSVA
jgi:methylmalonyl-CoA mutase cobalamin-binding subunit